MSGFIPDQSNEKATAGVALAARRKASDDHAGCAHGVNVTASTFSTRNTSASGNLRAYFYTTLVGTLMGIRIMSFNMLREG